MCKFGTYYKVGIWYVDDYVQVGGKIALFWHLYVYIWYEETVLDESGGQ